MNNRSFSIESFFGVLGRSQTYLNLLYLLLAFPLGLAYFILLVVGLSTGIALLIIWVGILILALTLAFSWAMTAFERQQAIALLRVSVPPMSQAQPAEAGTWQRLKGYLANPVTWKGLLFLFLKFPIGILTFTLIVTLIAVSLSLIAAPLIYPFAEIDFGVWQIDTMPEAVFCTLIGVILLPAGLHLLNLIAAWLGAFARVMLGQSVPAVQERPALPVA